MYAYLSTTDLVQALIWSCWHWNETDSECKEEAFFFCGWGGGGVVAMSDLILKAQIIIKPHKIKLLGSWHEKNHNWVGKLLKTIIPHIR